MSTTTRYALRPRAEVFDALADPHTYPHWLVGCREIRRVEDGWPEPGTRFHHRTGLIGPLAVEDDTEVLAVDAPDTLTLEVRFRPLGRGRVTFRLQDAEGSATRIDMDEVPLGALSIAAPVLDPLIHARNRASLNAFVAYLSAPACAH